MQYLAPVSSTQRLETLDVLRGFALLGILTMRFVGATAWPVGCSQAAIPSKVTFQPFA